MSDDDNSPYSNARLFAIREDRARGKAFVGALVLVIVLFAAAAVFFVFLMSGRPETAHRDAPAPEPSPSVPSVPWLS